MRKKVSEVIGRSLARSRLLRHMLGASGIIVAFHRVNEEFEENPLTFSPEVFREYCLFFRRHFDVVTVRELVGRIEEGAGLGGMLAVTFDDGYRDNFTVARPILKSLDLRATFFVTTGFIGTATKAWWDRSLKPQPGWMSWGQVRQLAAGGHEIGGHTHSHVDLGKVTRCRAQREISQCRARLTEELGEAPDSFAYPFGGRENLTRANREAIRAAGFRCCLAGYGGTVAPDSDPYNLYRIPLSPWHLGPGHFAFDAVKDHLIVRRGAAGDAALDRRLDGTVSS